MRKIAARSSAVAVPLFATIALLSFFYFFTESLKDEVASHKIAEPQVCDTICVKDGNKYLKLENWEFSHYFELDHPEFYSKDDYYCFKYRGSQ